MSAPKAHPKWGGRKRGTPNKVTGSAREAIELAFEGLGGVGALTAWAKDNQTNFFTRIWPKLLPLQISGDPENPLIPSCEPKPVSANTQEWLRKLLEEGRQKQQAEEAAITQWMLANPAATAAEYHEQVKKIADTINEQFRHGTPR